MTHSAKIGPCISQSVLAAAHDRRTTMQGSILLPGDAAFAAARQICNRPSRNSRT
jgi:hypothetical protein